ARETVLRRKDTPPSVLSTALPAPRPTVPLLLELPTLALHGDVPHDLVRELEGVLDRINLTLGLPLPRISIHATSDATPDAAWRLLAFELPIAQGALPSTDMSRAPAQAPFQA